MGEEKIPRLLNKKHYQLIIYTPPSDGQGIMPSTSSEGFICLCSSAGCKVNKFNCFAQMKLYEILSLNKELLERMHDFGIRTSDYYWVGLYKEYQTMLREGYKKMYIVALLSEHYNICERKVYKVISMMEKDCQIGST